MASSKSIRGIDRTPFVGRRSEQAFLLEALARGARLVSLVGPAGMGKTRLARRIASAIDRDEPPAGGIFFCDLTEARSEEDLLASVATSLGLSLRGGAGGGVGQLVRAVAAREPLLLLLDNFEALVPAGLACIESLLDGTSELQILVTSRIRLDLDGENAFELGPLQPEEAVQLYEQRAAAAWGDRRRDPGEAAVVEELVRRLDCIPLALELAAARIRVLPPADLLGRLSDRFDILQGPRRGRHTSLREALACSFELLSLHEREALLQASVFRGGFTLDAAAGVLRLGEGAPPILDALEGLRDKSLLRLEQGTAPRFSLYESVREFAAAELAASGGRAAAEAKHAAWFLAAAERWSPPGGGANGVAEVAKLQSERENLLVAHERTHAEDPATATRIALALGPLVLLQGPPTSEIGLFERSVDAARRSGDPLLLARALRARGSAAGRHGRPADARTDLDEAMVLAAAADEKLRAQLLIESGKLHCISGDFDGARAELGQALDLLGGAHPWLRGMSRNILGMVEERCGRLEESAASFEAALGLFRAAGNVRLEGLALLNLGVVRAAAGRLEDARALLEESLVLIRAVDDRATEADAIVDLGSVELTAGRLDEAERHLLQGLERERRAGNRAFEALALGNLGLVAQERRELRLAWRRLREALDLLQACGEPRYRALFLPFFAAAEAALGLQEEAKSDFAAARAFFEPLGDRGSLATIAVLEGFLDLVADGDGEALARARLARSHEAPVASAELALARRLVAAAIEARGAGAPAREGAVEQHDGLVIEGDAAGFQLQGGAPVDLRRRGPLRRLLQALVEQRIRMPGVGLTAEQLFAEGWPGERILASAAANRVYTGIRALRAMGLHEVLQRHAEGYLLDPDVPLHRARR
ncbi:ATP-binding protein [Vulgatibacter sp.]|uniref:ATP-binding protein n=1 Tax=Vulgatibacter sp. TaxID=1971226 RepID=UPI0035684928